MRLWPVWPIAGALLALVTGAIPDATPDDDDADVPDAITGTHAHEGWAIHGDGFYVWDEDRREAEEWAIELAGPAFPPRCKS